MSEKHIPTLKNFSPLPDLVSTYQFLFDPESLFNQAQNLNSEIFSFKLIYEPWIFLTGKDGLRFFAQLTNEQVDPFEFRKRMYTLQLPAAEMPADLPGTTIGTDKALKEYFEKMNEDELTKIFCEQIKKYLHQHLGTEGTIDNFYRMIVDISTQAFGVDFLGKELFETVPKDLGQIYADIDSTLTIPAVIFPFLPRKNRGKELNAKNKLVNYLLTALTKRKAGQITSPTPNLIDGYINLQKESGLSDENIVWLFNAMWWAAIHYSGVHGFWSGIEILTRPNLLADLDEEQNSFDKLNHNAIKKMFLLSGTIREGIRLNSIFALPRRVLQNLTFKNYEIPKNSVIAISPYLEHQNASIYVDPKKFDPLRWDEWAEEAMYESFVPGGIGFFGCKGMSFALHFLTVLWAVLLRNYRFELINPAPVIKKRQILLAPSEVVPLHYRRITE